jgi:hypothetical protein
VEPNIIESSLEDVMGRDKLEELREEWYSEPEEKPESVEDEVDDELLALNILFKSRGVTVAGEDSVKVETDDLDADAESEKKNKK